MLASTNDPIAAARRAQELAARQAREGTRVGGTEPFQAVRKIQQQIDELRELVVRLPSNEVATDERSGFSIVGSAWVTVASVSIPRASQFTRAVVQVNGSVSALRAGPGPAFDTRILINGEASPIQVGVAEAQGAVYQRCSGFPSHGRELAAMTAGSVSVQLQARGVLYSELTDLNSRSALTVLAGFSTI